MTRLARIVVSGVDAILQRYGNFQEYPGTNPETNDDEAFKRLRQ